MANPSLIGLIDTHGIELLHPPREGRSERQIGKKGLSNPRWIIGGKLCFVLNHLGLIVDWDVDTANVYDGSAFQEIAERNADQMVQFANESGAFGVVIGQHQIQFGELTLFISDGAARLCER